MIWLILVECCGGLLARYSLALRPADSPDRRLFPGQDSGDFVSPFVPMATGRSDRVGAPNIDARGRGFSAAIGPRTGAKSDALGRHGRGRSRIEGEEDREFLENRYPRQTSVYHDYPGRIQMCDAESASSPRMTGEPGRGATHDHARGFILPPRPRAWVDASRRSGSDGARSRLPGSGRLPPCGRWRRACRGYIARFNGVHDRAYHSSPDVGMEGRIWPGIRARPSDAAPRGREISRPESVA